MIFKNAPFTLSKSKKDVIYLSGVSSKVEYSDLSKILKYIMARLYSNAIVKMRYDKNIPLEDPLDAETWHLNYQSYHFILHKSSFKNQDVLLKVLHFLSGKSYIFFGSFPEWEYAVLPLEFEENKTEYRIKITNDVCLRVLQEINNYVELIYNDTELQDRLMSAVNTSDVENAIDKPSFFGIFKTILDERRVYLKVRDNESAYGLGVEDARIACDVEIKGNRELTHREASSNGGLSSYDGNRKLQPIVNELVIKFCQNKAYHEKNKFYEDIYDTLEKDYLHLLKEYSAYKRYLKDENVDWQRTIYDWCRVCMKRNNVTYTINKRIKPKYRKIT